ncbi:hypothetical protein ACFUMH_00210 [Cellulomonas sp. NPDC057328]|uniref:hypothetical protein n=1 Tax=Cellulomonas sp. NPDC057328 TaxID=3346101 RepID=UPI00362698CF
MSARPDAEALLREELTDPGTDDARIPYAAMELTSVVADQTAHEAYLMDLARSAERPVVRVMAAECLGQLVRERRRLTTDRVPLLLCDLLHDDDLVVRDSAAAALEEIRFWLSSKRRQAPVPLDSLPVERRGAYLDVGGARVWIGGPEDPGVRRVRRLLGDGVPLTRGLAVAVTTALATSGTAVPGAVHVHVAGTRGLPWWRWVFDEADVPGLTFRPPGTGRIAAPRVAVRRVKSLLAGAPGERATVLVAVSVGPDRGRDGSPRAPRLPGAPAAA